MPAWAAALLGGFAVLLIEGVALWIAVGLVLRVWRNFWR